MLCGVCVLCDGVGHMKRLSMWRLGMAGYESGGACLTASVCSCGGGIWFYSFVYKGLLYGICETIWHDWIYVRGGWIVYVRCRYIKRASVIKYL